MFFVLRFTVRHYQKATARSHLPHVVPRIGAVFLWAEVTNRNKTLSGGVVSRYVE